MRKRCVLSIAWLGCLFLSPGSPLFAQSNDTGRLVITPRTSTICPGHAVTLTASGGSSGSAIALNGVDQYVNLPLLNLAGSPGLTIEAWVYPTNIATQMWTEIIRQSGDGLPNWLLSFQDNGTTLSFGTSLSGNYTELDIPITASVYNDVWHHVAATWDGATRTVYVDGQVIGSDQATGVLDVRGTLHNIGSNGGYLEMFQGMIDEVRIWTVARSAGQIQSAMRAPVDASDSGLAGCWRFDECTGTVALDASGNGRNGLLISHPEYVSTGATLAPVYRWSPATGLNTTTGPRVVANPSTSTTYTVTALGDSCAMASATATVTVSPCTGDSGGIVISPPHDTLCEGQSMVLTASGGVKGNALILNGMDQYVRLPLMNLAGSTGLTLEAWIDPTDVAAQYYTEIIRQSGNGLPNWLLSFQEQGTILSFGTMIDGNYSELDVPIMASQFNDAWHHVAATWDGVTRTVYVDGRPIGSDVVTGSLGYCGTIHCIGSNAGYMEMFKGEIDEVRIWNWARMQSEIQSSMFLPLATGTPGLAGYWRLDECDGDHAADASGNGFDGVVVNGGAHEVPTSAPVDPLYEWSPATGLSSTVGSQVTVSCDSTTTCVVTTMGPNCTQMTTTVTVYVHKCNIANGGGGSPRDNLVMYPEPAVQNMTVEFPLPLVSDVILKVTDLLGRVVGADRRSGVTGTYRYTLNASRLPIGAYLVQLTVNGQSVERSWIRR